MESNVCSQESCEPPVRSYKKLVDSVRFIGHNVVNTPVRLGGDFLSRDRQKRWDAEHLGTVSCKLPLSKYQALRRACDAQGTSLYALVRRLVLEWLDKHGGPPAAPALALRW